MYLSLTSWSFPALTLTEAAGLSKTLGIDALDVGHHYRSALDRGEIVANPKTVAEQVKALGVRNPNYYHHFGDTLEERNLALHGTLDQNAKDLEQVMTFADAANIATVFILPGVINHSQSRKEAVDKSVESLNALLDVARGFNAELCIEPHARSVLESPDITEDLIDRTGIRLALDYSHYVFLGYRQQEVDPLAKHAAHVHLRQARPGKLQAKFGEGTLNFPDMFATFRDAGYTDALSIEYVHQGFIDAWYDDVLTETVLMRDCFNTWKGTD